MLLGRTDERLALDRLLAEAEGGRSGVLVLVGEPGIGKTALLDYTEDRAEGMHVLRARGVESEAEIPFAGLAELLGPVLSFIEQIPDPQAAALAGALSLGPAKPGDRFAVGAATLSLLSASAEELPLVLLVDDAHWLDGSSAEALRFAARRLVADPIAMVIASREGEASLLDGSDLRVLRVPGLARSDAAALLAESDLSGDVADRLIRTAGGNPLALLELASDGHGLAAAPPEVPVPISTDIASAFLRRFGRLPEPTRRVLVLAAASDTGDLGILERAAAILGLDSDDLVPAEGAGLIELVAGEVIFRHPLARAALYADAPASERRSAHAALASVLPDHDVDRRAWHLASASIGPDEAAAAALEQAGVRARERSAYAVASAAFERGAGLALEGDVRGRMLFAAAESAWLSGDTDRTLARLDEADPDAGTAPLSARVDHLRGQVAVRQGPVMKGYPLIVGASGKLADSDPDAASLMLAQAVHACFYAGDTPAMVAAANRAMELAERHRSDRVQFFATIANGMALIADGDGDAGAAAVRKAVEIAEGADELRDDPALLIWAAVGPLWLREADAGRGLIEEAFGRARAEVAVGVLPGLLHILARDQATTDQWSAAEASYDESIRLAKETGQRVELGAALAGLAWLEARQGREVSCRDHAAAAVELCGELGVGLYRVWAIQSIGDLELGLGRPDKAAEHYEAQAEALSELGIADVDLSPAPELVDVFLRLRRDDDAASVAAGYIADAEEKGQPWSLARAARCRGLLAGPEDDEMDSCFEEALRFHDRTPDLFEKARTLLAHGGRLRRVRRRVDARESLRRALASFERLGAAPWADQAEAELAATGETARRRDPSTLDDLTPQELQIARLLAGGKTTREAAAAIFVSPKTVEYHLRHVYQKLEIHSREELAERFAGR